MSQPINKISSGNIELSIWSNPSKHDDKHYLTFQLEHRWQDSGVWKSTSVLRKDDLPHAIACLNKAFELSAPLRVRISTTTC